MKNLLIVMSGPSGVGKGTIVNELLKRGNFSLSVSCTTRAPREGEENGKSYFFLGKEEFERVIKEGGFLEYSQHFGNYYGTPRKFVEDKLEGSDVILEIEVDGALQVKKAFPDAALVMILPPDENELRARLLKRGSESAEKIEERVKRMGYELSMKKHYNKCFVNGDLQKTVEDIESYLKSLKK